MSVSKIPEKSPRAQAKVTRFVVSSLLEEKIKAAESLKIDRFSENSHQISNNVPLLFII